MKITSVLAACCVAGCGGGGGGDGADGSAAADLREVAEAIYTETEAGGDVASYIEGVVVAFGFQVFGASATPADLDARLAEGLPFLLEPQMFELADAYLDGGYVQLDSLIAGAVEAGVTTPDGTPLTRAYLDAQLAAIAGKSEYTAAETLPAFVLALGAERAARYGGDDPLWGDTYLDPLQTTLLMYAFMFSALEGNARSAPAAIAGPQRGAQSIINFVGDRVKGRGESVIVNWLEIPIDADDDAIKAIMCASMQLYGHKMEVTVTPDLIYHQQADPAQPFSSTINAVLTFEEDYWDGRYVGGGIDQWIVNSVLDCKLQLPGTVVPNKPLTWTVSDGLTEHGTFAFAQSMTDAQGLGVGNWRTIPETTPVAKRTFANKRDAVGAVVVRATGLVPGWSGVERAVNAIKDTGGTGDDPLTVIYYVDPCAGTLRAGGICADTWAGTARSTYTVPGEGGYEITADVVWTPVVSDDIGTIYEAAGTVTYEHFQEGCTATVNPATVAITSDGGASNLEILYGEDPVTYSGSGGMFWMATLTLDCPPDPPGSGPFLVGGGYFGTEPIELTDPTTLSDSYDFMTYWHYEYSFQRQ